MMIALVPLMAVVLGAGSTDDAASTPKVAQVRLVETLGGADSIEAVSARGRTVTFTIVRDGELLRVAVATSRKGEILSFATISAGPADVELHGLTWLAGELAEATAITRLVADEDGAVTISTSDGQRYMAIPGRGSGGNAAVEARWAAAWSRHR
jgi:hypothetical protein